MTYSRVLPVIAAAALIWSIPTPAPAFTDSEAREAIVELRQQLRLLEEITQRASMQQAQRIDMLEEEITRLRGQIEELGGPRNASMSSSGQEPVQAQDSEEQAAFDGGMQLYRDGDVAGAEESLAAFLTLYPNSVLAPTAQFYLGSAYYANKKYQDALSVLNTMAGKYPDHPRAPDALLVVAGSELELSGPAATKATLEKIIKDYPDSVAAQTATERLKLL